MQGEPTIHPVHTVLHRPLLEHGVDVKYLLAAIAGGLLTLWVPPRSVILALLVGGGLYGAARWATKREPQMIEILLLAWRDRRRGRLPRSYDPLAYEPLSRRDA